MSNDAKYDRRGGDRRHGKTRWPEKEPLALKLIRDNLEGEDKAFARNVCLFYDGIVQIITMRGEGCPIYAEDFERFVFLDRKCLKRCREFLVKLQLIRIHEQPAPQGGNRKTLFYYLEPAPYAGYREGTRDDCDPNPGYREGTREICRPNGASMQSDTPPSTEREPIEVSEVSSSCSPNGEHSEATPASGRSLKTWTRAQLRKHHESNPECPPEGRQIGQMLTAVLKTADPAEFDRVCQSIRGGYNALYVTLQNMTCAIDEPGPEYRELVDAALTFEKIPTPSSSQPSLGYVVAALKNKALEIYTIRAEEEGRKKTIEGNIGHERYVEDDDEFAEIVAAIGGGE